jgi:hypothetical protein
MPDVRLINANELLRVIDEEIEYGAEYAAKDYQLINKGLKIARKDIKCAPTIDAQPVMHGRWSECWRDPARNLISVICSACEDASLAYLPKKDLSVDDVPNKICIQMPYCPKCGAKMCGGDADGNQV